MAHRTDRTGPAGVPLLAGVELGGTKCICILGTGAQLFAMIRARLQSSLNEYLDLDEVGAGIDGFIAPSALGAAVGPLGALAVAADRWYKTAA